MSDDQDKYADFSDHPESVNELRPNGTATDWTPREALVSLLRDIDQGVIRADAVLVLAVEINGARNRPLLRVSTPDVMSTLGLIELAKMEIFLAAVHGND